MEPCPSQTWSSFMTRSPSTNTPWLFLLCLACSAPGASANNGDEPWDDRTSGTDGGLDGDSPGREGGSAAPLRFVALGDAGKGNEVQYQVADGMGKVCAANGCAF